MNGSYHGIATAHSDGRLPAVGAGARSLFGWLSNLVLGCWHRHKSFPFTPVRRDAPPGAPRSRTYMVCLDCGATFDYDWNQMRMGPPTPPRPARGRAGSSPRIAAIALEPAGPPAPEHRYQGTRDRVHSLTA
jgi:hypothetical protein